MIVTLSITILVESLVVGGYCLWRRKPLPPILFTSLWANLLTQSLLWIGLSIFFQQYRVTLLIAEVIIWILESLLLYAMPANRLHLTDAIILSLIMNLLSFGTGWFLPV